MDTKQPPTNLGLYFGGVNCLAVFPTHLNLITSNFTPNHVYPHLNSYVFSFYFTCQFPSTTFVLWENTPANLPSTKLKTMNTIIQSDAIPGLEEKFFCANLLSVTGFYNQYHAFILTGHFVKLTKLILCHYFISGYTWKSMTVSSR